MTSIKNTISRVCDFVNRKLLSLCGSYL